MELDDAATKLLEGQPEIWQLIFSFANSMALKCAVELGLPDILHSHHRPLSLSEIASKIPGCSSPNLPYLYRIMRLLVYNKIFTYTTPSPDSDGGVYGPTAASRWLLRDTNELSLAPLLIMQVHPIAQSPWHQLSSCVREGGDGFQKAHGCKIWSFAGENPEFNRVFNAAMACTGKITINAVLTGLRKDTWAGLESLVDVGGGIGHTIAEIVKTHPHIKGINFDLPHVLATAPKHPGVSHVGGNMFDAIPTAQAVLMKWIMHDWDDEDCLKILRNCQKAIPEKTGKIFIVDLVLKADGGDELFGGAGLASDVLMIAHTAGKERNEIEWKNLLEKAGFSRYKITQLPTFYSMIEAYPN